MNQPEPTLLPGLRRADRGHASTFREREMHNSSRESNLNSRYRETVLHDNSYGGIRGFGGELPFCYGEPLVLRKQEDLGISIQEKEIGAFQIEFSGTIGDGEHETIPCQVKTGYRLCVPCKDTIRYFLKYLTRAQQNRESSTFEGENSHPLLDMEKNVLLHPSLLFLYANAHIGKTLCYLCMHLWEKIENLFPDLKTNTYANYRIEACWRLRPELEAMGEPKIWFIMVNSTVEKEGYYNWQPLYRLSMWSATSHGKYFDKSAHATSIIPIRGPWDDCADDGSNNALPSRQLVLAWFQKCKANKDGQHELCNRQDSGFLPTRLIDVPYALEYGKVRLVCWRDSPGHFETSADKLYVTLSHCWGEWGSKNNPNLLSTNIKDRVLTGLNFDSLPATFMDAIKIASWFGWNWLWIDSLCIIQDSKTDWASEAAIMDKVYRNSQINISADLGDDSRSGCFVQPDSLLDYALTIGLEGCEDEWHLTGDREFQWTKAAPSFSRAWIHRERQLSRRILHCTSDEFVWECCGLGNSGFASQSMPGGAPFETIFDNEIKFQVQWQQALEASDHETKLKDPQNIDRKDEEEVEDESLESYDVVDLEKAKHLDKVYGLWNTTCQDLSNKSVTFATDMPIILSSLAREFQEMIPDDEYVCGHWRSTLPESLGWFTRNPKKADLPYVAPSWSWLSIAKPVQLPIRSYHKRNIPVAEVVNIDCDYTADDPYGQVTKGELKILGYIRRLHFYFLGNGHFIISVIDELDEEERIRVVGPDWNPTDGLTCQMTTDKTLCLEGQEWECTALFTVISETGQDLSTCQRKLSCVLLEEVDHETPEAVAVPPLYHELLGHLHGPDGPTPTVYTMTSEDLMRESEGDKASCVENRGNKGNDLDKLHPENKTPLGESIGRVGEHRSQGIETDEDCRTADLKILSGGNGETVGGEDEVGKPEVDGTVSHPSTQERGQTADAKGAPRRYVKVGTLNNICDEYSFKLRYTVHSYEDDEVKGAYRSDFINNSDGYSGPTITQNLSADEDEPPSNAISDDIWDNLAEFIARNRWAVLYQAQLDEKASKKEESDEADAVGKEEPFKITERLRQAETDGAVKAPAVEESTAASEATLSLNPKRQADEGSSCNDQMGLDDPLLQLHGGTEAMMEPDETLPGHGPSDKDESSGSSSRETERTVAGGPIAEEVSERPATLDDAPPMLQIYLKVLAHPCGFARRVTGADKLKASVREFLAFDSEHPAYGRLDADDALYQFDQVLWDWMDAQKICQWLIALEPVELIIV